MFISRCAKCGQPILDKCVSALDKTWHPECFVCSGCGCDFGVGAFTSMMLKSFYYHILS